MKDEALIHQMLERLIALSDEVDSLGKRLAVLSVRVAQMERDVG